MAHAHGINDELRIARRAIRIASVVYHKKLNRYETFVTIKLNNNKKNELPNKLTRVFNNTSLDIKVHSDNENTLSILRQSDETRSLNTIDELVDELLDSHIQSDEPLIIYITVKTTTNYNSNNLINSDHVALSRLNFRIIRYRDDFLIIEKGGRYSYIFYLPYYDTKSSTLKYLEYIGVFFVLQTLTNGKGEPFTATKNKSYIEAIKSAANYLIELKAFLVKDKKLPIIFDKPPLLINDNENQHTKSQLAAMHVLYDTHKNFVSLLKNKEPTMLDKIKDHIEFILNKKSAAQMVREKNNEIESGDVSPFFLALFGKKMTLTAKIAQSYQTTFGMSLWEPISKKLAESQGWECETQYKLLGQISQEAQDYIHSLLEDINYTPDRDTELAEINTRSIIEHAESLEYPDATVDVFIRTDDGTEICIDITTAKPSKKEFRALKRKLLMWAAIRYSQDPSVNFQPYIAIPYNPNAGDYTNHQGCYDRKDLLVGDELWRKVSNNNIGIEELMSVFINVGDRLKVEINTEIDKIPD